MKRNAKDVVVCSRFGSTLLPAQALEGQISKEARSRMSEEDERPHLEYHGRPPDGILR